MRKKMTGLLAVLACLLLLSACGAGAAADEPEIDQETMTALYSLTESTVQSMDEVVAQGLIEDQKSNATIYSGLQGWEKAKEELGSIDFTADADGNGLADCFTEKSVSIDDDNNYIVTVEVAGSDKTADFVATYNEDLTEYVSLVTNINYSSQELIQQAGLNTLLGMGTTFCVLILLSLIIALFGKIFTDRAKKKLEEEAKKEAESQSSSAPAAAREGQGSLDPLDPLADDGAIIAVIAAAVTAYRAQAEPDVDPGAYIVRRIRRIHRS